MKHANIALFIPHNGCPHQCSFCNQVRITGMQKQPSPQDVISAVTTARESLGERLHKAEIAFFGGSFTAVEPNYMRSLLETASTFVKSGTVAGIRISTRPDALEAPVLDLLKRKGVTAIELGAQSMDDSVLAMNGRGHTAQQVREASRRIRDNGFSLGLQMMTGLYGSSAKQDRQTAEELAQLRPDTMRIYPTVVMEGTRLAELYQQGLYHPMELDEACAVRRITPVFRAAEHRGYPAWAAQYTANGNRQACRSMASGVSRIVRKPADVASDQAAFVGI